MKKIISIAILSASVWTVVHFSWGDAWCNVNGGVVKVCQPL